MRLIVVKPLMTTIKSIKEIVSYYYKYYYNLLEILTISYFNSLFHFIL